MTTIVTGELIPSVSIPPTCVFGLRVDLNISLSTFWANRGIFFITHGFTSIGEEYNPL